MSGKVVLTAGVAAGLLFLLAGQVPQTSTLLSAEPPPGQAAVKKAAPIPAESVDIPTAAAELKILKALAEPAKLDFIEEPLAGVMKKFSAEHQIEIVLDIRALDEVDIGADEPITRHLSGISLRSALDLVLRDLDLTWTIDSEVLLITTLDEADNRLTTKTYDVGDLVVCQDEDGQRWDDYESLIETILSTIAPDTWEQITGGPGVVEGCTFASAKVLVIRQTLQVQVEVAQLLDTIRKVIAAHGTDGEPPVREQSPPVCPNCGMGSDVRFGGMGGGGVMGGFGFGGGGMMGGVGIGAGCPSGTGTVSTAGEADDTDDTNEKPPQ